MTAKKSLAKEFEDIKNELSRIPMSSEAVSKMSLNPYDQLFICRLMSLRDDATKNELAEIILAQNKKMFMAMDEQTKVLHAIGLDIVEIKMDMSAISVRLGDVESEICGIKKRLNRVERRVDKIEEDKK